MLRQICLTQTMGTWLLGGRTGIEPILNGSLYTVAQVCYHYTTCPMVDTVSHNKGMKLFKYRITTRSISYFGLTYLRTWLECPLPLQSSHPACLHFSLNLLFYFPAKLFSFSFLPIQILIPQYR